MKNIQKGVVATAIVLAAAAFAFLYTPKTYAVMPAPTGVPTEHVTGLYRTGVDDLGNKLPAGSTDSHWVIQSVSNSDAGDPHCQEGPFPRQASVTGSNIPNSTGTEIVWTYTPTNANWIGAKANGWNDNTQQCPDPSTAYAPPTNQQHSAIWNFALPFTISKYVDPDTVTLQYSGVADNSMYVYINGTLVHSYQAFSDVVFNTPTPGGTVAVSGVFVNGVNTLVIKDRSSSDMTGFVLSELASSAKYYPSLAIEKTISANTVPVGQSTTYSIKVTNNSGEYGQPTKGKITVTDAIPDQFTVQADQLPSDCTANGQNVTCESVQVLNNNDANSALEYKIPVVANTVAEGVVNTAYVSGGGDPICGNPGVEGCSSSVPATIVVKAPSTGISLFLRNPFMIVAIGAAAAIAVLFVLRKKVLARS